MEKIKEKIRTIHHWPKQGIMFRDITTLLKDAEGFKLTMDAFEKRYKGRHIDIIVGIESRGFIIGAALADRLGKGFVPIRKKGKLPAEVERHEYELEYGTDCLEIHRDAIKKGQKVLIVDDLLATGGTIDAAAELIKKLGGDIVECAVIIDLPEVGGSKKLRQKGHSVFKLVDFEGK